MSTRRRRPVSIAGDGGDEADASAVSPCGDGTVAGAEVCGDGNTTNGDGCSSRCVVESGWSGAGQPSTCHARGECTSSTLCRNGGTCTIPRMDTLASARRVTAEPTARPTSTIAPAAHARTAGTCTDGVEELHLPVRPG